MVSMHSMLFSTALPRKYGFRTTVCCLNLCDQQVGRSDSQQSQRVSFSQYSRMLDMGGAPSSSTTDKSSIRLPGQASKCAVQAVCLEWSILTQSMQQQKGELKDDQEDTITSELTGNDKSTVLGNVVPNVAAVQTVAGLLNVKLGDDQSSQHKKSLSKDHQEDDLSLLLGKESDTNEKISSPPQKQKHEKG